MTSSGTIGENLPNIITFVQGIAICITNGLLLLTIIHEASFRKRKELLLIGGLAASDLVNGMGATLAGFYLANIVWQGEQNIMLSEWDCVKMPLVTMSYIGPQLTAVMNVMVSIDRLMAVAWPIKYRLLDKRYAYTVLALVTLFGLSSTMTMILTTYFGTDHDVLNVNKACDSHLISTYPYYIFYIIFNPVAGYISVAIYMGVYFAYRRALGTSGFNDGVTDQQRRLTVTVGIIAISTLVLFNIPYSIFVFCAFNNIPTPQSVLLGVLIRFSTICNVAIYLYRQKEMRAAMGALICFKNVCMTATVSTFSSHA